MPYCAVYRCSSCYRKKGNITFHSFPKNEETRRRWIQLCGRQDFINADNAVICSLHFEETAFQRNLKYELLGVTVPKNLVRIKEGSVPTLLLPSTQGEHVSSSREVRARRRGQKRLVEEILGQDGEDSPAEAVEADSDDRRRNEQTVMPKRKRGRPRKNEKLFQVNEEDIPAEALDRDSGDWRRNEQIVVPRRKRGRPRKYEQVQKTSKSKAHPPEEENSHIGVYVDVAEDPEGCSENSDTLPRVHSEIRMLKEDDDDKTFVAQEWDWPELDKVKKEIEEPESVSDHFEVKHEEEMVQVKEEK